MMDWLDAVLGFVSAAPIVFAFGGPSVPKPQPPPPPPTVEDKSVQEEAAKERRRLRSRTGRSSTLLAGDTLGATGTLGGGPVPTGGTT